MAKAYKLTIPSDRAERLQYIKRMFPQAGGTALSDDWRGGRSEATKRLNSIDIEAYNKNRYFINGDVSRLSPYFRYGCLTLKEAADHLQKQFGVESEKLVQALGRRDYSRRVWYQQGDKIFNNLEKPKVGLGDKPLPDYVRQMITGLPCMDAFVRDLMQDGYVHNHARKWFASYVVHWLKVDWREAADWFESLLLDGDKASNHLSWQWVASSFSSSPYFFNKDILARHTGEKHCANCTVSCPFDASVEMLDAKLFSAAEQLAERTISRPATMHFSSNTAVAVFVHDEMLSAAHPLIQNSTAKFFVFDEHLYAKWPLKRLQFVADCLSELPNVEVWLGDTRDVLESRGVGQLKTQNTPNKDIKQLLESFQVDWQPEVKMIDVEVSDQRMKRFSRYWSKVSKALYGDALPEESKTF